MNHTVINHGGNPVQATVKFDFALSDRATPQEAADRMKYIEDTALALEATYGVGNVFTIDRLDVAIGPRGSKP